MAKLYRKLYLYAFGILLVTLLLTGVTMALLFDHHQRGFVQNIFHRQVLFIRREVLKAQHKSPAELGERIQELSEQLGWQIVYWKQNQVVYGTLIDPPRLRPVDLTKIREQGFVVSFHWFRKPPQVVLYLHPKHPEHGILWLQLKADGLSRQFFAPLVAAGLLLFFLALLLIPYIYLILKPYKTLQASIQRVAEGDFSQPIQVNDYKNFTELVQAFNHMSEQIQQTIQQKQRLIADVSHELRSPLTRLRMVLEILLNKSPENQMHIQRGIAETQELDRIIQDLLDISRLELDKVELYLEEVDFRYFIYQMVEKHQELFDQKSFVFAIDFPQEPTIIWIDKKWMTQVFNNLFANLLKYVPDNNSIDLVLNLEGKNLLFTLRDRGPGIPDGDLEKIFQPFYRADLSRSRRTGGVGLGLAIVKHIIQVHQGEIKMAVPQDSEGGLLIEIYLPLHLNPGELGKTVQSSGGFGD